MVTEQSTAAPPTIVHCPLDAMQAFDDGAHFLWVMAATQFVVLVWPFLLAFHAEAHALAFASILGEAALVFLLLWSLFQRRTRLVLGASILFCIVFSKHYYEVVLVLGNNNLIFRYAALPTISSRAAVAAFLLLLGYVNYQIVRAGWQTARLSDADRIAARGDARSGLEGFLLQFFGIPAICGWLAAGWQRRCATGFFFIATMLFYFFISAILSWLFIFFPDIELQTRDFAECRSQFGEAACAALTLIPAVVLPVELAVAAGAVAVLRFAARRLTRLSLERLVGADTRSPILFLRSFRDDQVKLTKPRREPLRRLISIGEPRPTLDHVLLEDGTPHGPVVAIGAPGSTPPFGAARKYVTDEEWRDVVLQYCRDASAIVITLDETEGVHWELRQVITEDCLIKTLFLVPPRFAAPRQIWRVLPAAFAALPHSADWIERLHEAATLARRECIGWFWRDDRQIDVLTVRAHSEVAYRLAVRLFLNRVSEQAALAAPAPSAAETRQAVEERETALARKRFLGAGIALTFACLVPIAMSTGFLISPVLAVIAAYFILRRSGVPLALLPTLGIGTAHCAYGIIGGVVMAIHPVAGLVEAGDLLSLFLTAAIYVGLIIWAMKARSRAAAIGLLIFQGLNALGLLAGLVAGEGRTAMIAAQAVLFLLAAAASIYALIKLPRRPARMQQEGAAGR